MLVSVSGLQLKLTHVKLYHAKAIARWRALVVNGSEKMGSVSTGLGLIGSPGWVMGGGIALGMLEAALTAGANRQGAELLTQANTLLDEMRTRAEFFPVSTISGVKLPTPEAWNASNGPIQFVVLGSDFLDVLIDGEREYSIRWSSVDTYSIVD